MSPSTSLVVADDSVLADGEDVLDGSPMQQDYDQNGSSPFGISLDQFDTAGHDLSPAESGNVNRRLSVDGYSGAYSPSVENNSETVDENVCAESDLETIADVGLPPEALPESSNQRCSNTSCTFVKHDGMTPHSDSTFGGKTGTANVSTRSAARSSVSFSTSISVFFSLIKSATAHTSSFLSPFHTDTTPTVGTTEFKYPTIHSHQTFIHPDEMAEYSSPALSLWESMPLLLTRFWLTYLSLQKSQIL